MKVYKFWCQPSSTADNALLCTQLRLAANYRRELATMENLARMLKRAIEQRVPLEARPNWRKQEEYKALMRQIGDEQAEAVRRARGRASAGGLYWGSYLTVEESIEQARRTTKFWDDIRVFAPYDEGRVCVQIQKSKPLHMHEVIGGSDTRVQIDAKRYGFGPRVDRFATVGEPGVRNHEGVVRPERMRTMRIRVGSDPASIRQPIWARLHINTFHGRGSKRHDRWLDAGTASVKWVFVQRVRTGLTYRWEAIFIVDQDAVEAKPAARDGSIAFDLGWRRVEGGMRLAYWKNDRSEHGQIVIPDHVISRAGKSDELRSTRDDLRNSESAWLKAWIDDRVPAMPVGIDSVSETDAMEPRNPSIAPHVVDRTIDITALLRESSVHMLSWRRMARFERLWRTWRDNRFLGDSVGFDRLDSWLKRDRFLYEWEAHNRRRMILQITGRVDEFVVAACKRYETVIVEKFDLNDLKERDESRVVGSDAETQRMINARQIQKLAPGRMRESIERFAKKYQCQLVKVPAADTTKQCASCGFVRQPDPEVDAELDITCPSCNVECDQDLNAAENLLRRAAVQLQHEITHTAPNKLKLSARRTRKKPASTGGSDRVGVDSNQ